MIYRVSYIMYHKFYILYLLSSSSQVAQQGGDGGGLSEVEKVVDSMSLTRRKYFQKLGLTGNIWEN